MGRAPCCDKANVKKGPWSPEEDAQLKDYMDKYGTGGNWIALPQKAGLKRCGKSCRLRWLNYLRPNIKHGEFSNDEDRIICTLYANIGSRWSIIAAQLPGRTDNDIKNYWNTKLKKKIMAGCSHVILNPPPPPPPPPPSPPSILHNYSPYSYYNTNSNTFSFTSSSEEDQTHVQNQTQMANLQSFGSFYGSVEDETHVQNQMCSGGEMINSTINPLESYYGQIEEIKNLISSCSSNTSNYVSTSSNYSRLSNVLFDENKGSSLSYGRSGCTTAIDADCLYNHKN